MSVIIRRTAGAPIPAAPAVSRWTFLRAVAVLWLSTIAVVVAALFGWGWLA